MCELFAMSARAPATVTFSLSELARHGGLTAPHADGWGVAFVEDRDARLFREPAPASTSACVRFLEDHPIRSTLVLSHLRHATRGAVSLENTQPFARELGGRVQLFAHNGDLPGVRQALALGRFRPIGETDSEHAFCALLGRLEALPGASEDQLTGAMETVAGFARELRVLGPANFLYADGERLYAHAHERKQAGGRIAPPGLHLLGRRCAAEPSAETAVRVEPGAGEQEVLLLASVPLTTEAWEALPPGVLLAVERGRLAARLAP